MYQSIFMKIYKEFYYKSNSSTNSMIGCDVQVVVVAGFLDFSPQPARPIPEPLENIYTSHQLNMKKLHFTHSQLYFSSTGRHAKYCNFIFSELNGFQFFSS